MSFTLDKSLLALTSSKNSKEPRSQSARPPAGRADTPFQLPQEASDRTIAARSRMAERRGSSPAPERASRTDEPRRTDPPRRSEPPRRADRPERNEPAERANPAADARLKTPDQPRRADDRAAIEGETQPSNEASEPVENAEAFPAESTTDEPAIAGQGGEIPVSGPVEADAKDGGSEGMLDLNGEAAPDAAATLTVTASTPEAMVEQATEGSKQGSAAAGAPMTPVPGGSPLGTLEGASEDTQTSLASAPKTGQELSAPAAPEAQSDGEATADPAIAVSDQPETFADHLKAEPGTEKVAGADPSRLAETLDSDQEQAAPSASSIQPGSAQKSGQPSQAASAAAPQVPIAQQVPMGAVPIEIGMKAIAGVNRFEIRLDPAELGRIDVTLEIDEGGEVKAHLVVDRVETLALLQRDAKTLERAFEQAGLKPSEGGVDLSLRDPSGDGRFQQQQNQDERGRSGVRTARDEGSETERAERPAPQPKPLRWHGASGVDLRI